MSKAEWVRVSRTEPCPICGKPRYCTRSADGTVSRCMRIESDHVSGNGWLHRLDEPLPERQPEPAPEKKANWTTECKAMYQHRLAPERRSRIAVQLGVSVQSLELLRVGVGWDQWSGREFSSWPARDPSGRCVGFVRRYDDGAKKTNRGGSTGLFYAPQWQVDHGPILIVEGGSDVAACLSAGLCAIGRPSNTGGVSWIRQMVRAHPRIRVIVIGERDEKPGKRGTVSQCPATCQGCSFCWPGLYGMQQTAAALNADQFMPANHKDVREYLQHASGEALLRQLTGESNA